MTKQETEAFSRDLLMKALSGRFGEAGSMKGTEKSAQFQVKSTLGGGTCSAEGSLTYDLPSGRRIQHKNDILISIPGGRYIAIELKHSATTDQFKARSYDMIHLKRTLGEKVCGILVYAHVPNIGIGLENAKDLSYPFDRFVGVEIPIELPDELNFLRQIVEAVESAVESELARMRSSDSVTE